MNQPTPEPRARAINGPLRDHAHFLSMKGAYPILKHFGYPDGYFHHPGSLFLASVLG
jgi:hypothetical protein